MTPGPEVEKRPFNDTEKARERWDASCLPVQNTCVLYDKINVQGHMTTNKAGR